MSGLLVVNRLELMRQSLRRGNLQKKTPALALSPEQLFRTYRGFDGQIWPGLTESQVRLNGGLASLAQIALVEEYLTGLGDQAENDMIILEFESDAIGSSVSAEWSFAGYELGYFDSQWSHFSIILNEVLYGHDANLQSHARNLNENLLLHSKQEAQTLLVERANLARSGVDVEGGEKMCPIAVYARSTRAS